MSNEWEKVYIGDGGITLNSDGCEGWKPMIVVAADSGVKP